jgi:hypothetical protein
MLAGHLAFSVRLLPLRFKCDSNVPSSPVAVCPSVTRMCIIIACWQLCEPENGRAGGPDRVHECHGGLQGHAGVHEHHGGLQGHAGVPDGVHERHGGLRGHAVVPVGVQERHRGLQGKA